MNTVYARISPRNFLNMRNIVPYMNLAISRLMMNQVPKIHKCNEYSILFTFILLTASMAAIVLAIRPQMGNYMSSGYCGSNVYDST